MIKIIKHKNNVYELENGYCLYYNKSNGYYYTIETPNGFGGEKYEPIDENGKIVGFVKLRRRECWETPNCGI